ncbi:thioredoxin domain-containing protein [Tupanvirus deep ocean]|uniref:Thioredoxin domain-containing protein n=2 Tax=Tupanvirus TaxID=2094720 RepID=A0AC62A8X7_9VIRU|nr:thioredoxin domain-containing protein [Tupanvirus deep ocean]QKU34122.1 thioredoxin domain-containing protein [Tupanvirus deep ocean]
MIGNLTAQQILLIILGIVVLLWLIYWLVSCKKTNKVVTNQPQYRHPGYVINQQQPIIRQPQAPQTTVQQHPPVQQSPVVQPGQNISADTVTQQESPFTLYYFHSPLCKHCKDFNPAWEEVANRLKNINGINMHKIDATRSENENLAFYYNITGYPTVILVTPDKNVEYNGDRSAHDLHNFVVSNVNEYSQNNQYVPNNQFDVNNRYANNNQYITNNQYPPNTQYVHNAQLAQSC